MNIDISWTPEELAEKAGKYIAERINEAISLKGECRILLSTGESQILAIQALTKQKVDWSKVVMFHLDEYVDLPETHKASFRKYLKERFVDIVHPKEANFVDGEGDIQSHIDELTEKLREKPIDVAVVGIGENGHIAFNDPPADFTTDKAYIVVTLDNKCKQQQVNEGWFETIGDVPERAISMSVPQIMKSRTIITIVPGIRKQDPIYNTLSSGEITNLVPATILKSHRDWHLFIDADSSAKIIPMVKG